ncbi:hypothetical protein SYNPS1DRAFT_29183 [Syncephalis pseudoplumigaleata]|uniref:Uncharacterized protein n=1 Tax=Syncephalis pseudoplumigaleata TaxID=1712513 RepID=A0A4V1J1H4_9FUNG|nr:hypothetical protein SYNPS1DRAFT_29183 [Syncephalis pseudoplumigaleata]|eukprot:RKP25069.1 hypothetical protein SYNPS1DRAFT_29183 [Syncephalis pseudoplumigaleata]
MAASEQQSGRGREEDKRSEDERQSAQTTNSGGGSGKTGGAQSDHQQHGMPDRATRPKRYRPSQAARAQRGGAETNYVRKEIWIPRCKDVKALLGTWATRLRRVQNETPPPPTAPVLGPRRHTQDDRPHAGSASVAGSRESASYWDRINRRVFDIDHYLKIVAPAWAH